MSLIYDLCERVALLGPTRIDRRPPRDLQRNIDAGSWNNLIALVWEIRDVLRGLRTSEPWAEVQTTDQTPEVAATYEPAVRSAVVVRATVGAGAADGVAAGWELWALYRRVDGVLTKVSTTKVLANLADSAMTGCSADLSISDGAVAVVIAGLAATTINWRISLRADERALPAPT